MDTNLKLQELSTQMELLKKDLSATRRQLVSVIVKYQEMQYELQTRDGAGDRNRNLTRDVYLRDKSREPGGLPSPE